MVVNFQNKWWYTLFILFHEHWNCCLPPNNKQWQSLGGQNITNALDESDNVDHLKGHEIIDYYISKFILPCCSILCHQYYFTIYLRGGQFDIWGVLLF